MHGDTPSSTGLMAPLVFRLEKWRTANLGLVHTVFSLAWIQYGFLQIFQRTPYTSVLGEFVLNKVLPYTWIGCLGTSLAFYLLPYLTQYYRRRGIGLPSADAMTFEGQTMTGTVFWDTVIFGIVFLGGFAVIAWIVVSMSKFT